MKFIENEKLYFNFPYLTVYIKNLKPFESYGFDVFFSPSLV